MSMDPITTAIKVYEFINQPLPMKLFKWIEDSTQVEVSQLGMGYGTVKNSIQTMNAWRHRMTFEEVCPFVIKSKNYENSGEFCAGRAKMQRIHVKNWISESSRC